MGPGRKLRRPVFSQRGSYVYEVDVEVVLGFIVPSRTKVIRRRDLGLKSHTKDWRSPIVEVEGVYLIRGVFT